ncbi:hypothetical protein D3C72_1061530 [compost metagenome]
MTLRAWSFMPMAIYRRATSSRTHALVGSAAIASSSIRRALAVSPCCMAWRAWVRAWSARSRPSGASCPRRAGVMRSTSASASAVLFCACSASTSPRVAAALSGCARSTRR